MPAMPYLIALGIGAAGGLFTGFVAGKGTSGVGNVIKYTVIGAGLIVVGRELKII